MISVFIIVGMTFIAVDKLFIGTLWLLIGALFTFMDFQEKQKQHKTFSEHAERLERAMEEAMKKVTD
jgi:hypothetical protein